MGQAACCSECSQRAPGPAGGPSASAPAEGEARSPAPGRGRSPGQHDAWCVPEESDKLNTTLALASGSSKPYPHVAARKAPGKLDAIDEGYTVEPGSWHHALEEPGSSTKDPEHAEWRDAHADQECRRAGIDGWRSYTPQVVQMWQEPVEATAQAHRCSMCKFMRRRSNTSK